MPYLERIIQAQSERPDLFKPGTVSSPSIEHDHWCPILTQPDKVRAKQAAACECNPDITVRIDGEAYRITLRGHVVRIGASQ